MSYFLIQAVNALEISDLEKSVKVILLDHI